MADLAESVMGIVLTLIIIVSVGIAFTGQQVDELTSTNSITNESFNASVINTEISLANDNIQGTPTVLGSLNGSSDQTFDGMGIINAGNYTIDNAGGVINMSQSNFANGVYNISYSFRSGTFVDQGSSVTLLNLLVLFLAIGGLAILAKGMGLI